MKFRLLLAALALQIRLFAQDCPPENGLPSPPPVPVRAMAEWEELRAVVVAWYPYHPLPGYSPQRSLVEIIRAAREECEVLVICYDNFEMADAQAALTAAGVDWSSNVRFLIAPTNTIWIRDYGPSTVYRSDNGQPILVDWIYDRYFPLSNYSRTEDDTVAGVLAQYFQAPLHTTTGGQNGLVVTGGNFMTDGLGRAFASRLLFDENAMPDVFCSQQNQENVGEILDKYMGIKELAIFERWPFDLVDHIDMQMKLVSENTFAFGEYPGGVSNGPQQEANLLYLLDQWTAPGGGQYRIFRLPMPPNGAGLYPTGQMSQDTFRTYLNALFVNKTILVPTYDAPTDSTALRIWRENMPGFRIVGIPSNPLIRRFGAVHCITKEVGAASPLSIRHAAPACFFNDEHPEGYRISAQIEHPTGIAEARLFYKTDLLSDWFSTVLMPNASGGSWSANVPQQTVGSEIYYYFEAQANDGKTQRRPMPAPEGYFKFKICGESGVDVPSDVPSLQPIFPNPASGVVCVPIVAPVSGTATIVLENALGHIVETIFSGRLVAGEQRFYVDAGRFDPGFYFVKFKNNTRSIGKSLVILR